MSILPDKIRSPIKRSIAALLEDEKYHSKEEVARAAWPEQLVFSRENYMTLAVHISQMRKYLPKEMKIATVSWDHISGNYGYQLMINFDK